MKKYARPLTHDEGLAKAKEQGLEVDDAQYKGGSDYIAITFPDIGKVLWSSWNGKFLGMRPSGISFHSDNSLHDREPWMQTLLDFFYHPLEKP